MADLYGIPEGGNNGPYVAKKWQGINWQLSWEEMIATVALGGWPHSLWAEAAATSAAESSRNPFIYNTYKLGHFGLFQISRSAHGDFFTGANAGAWVVPPENAREGYAVYKSEGWGAWQAHSSGAYGAFLLQAKAAVSAFDKKAAGRTGTAYWQSLYRDKTREYIASAALAINPSVVGEAIAGGVAAGAEGAASGVVDSGAAVASSVGDMAQVVTGAWNLLTNPSIWMRAGYGTLGVILVAGGLFLVVRNQPAVQKAAKQVASAVPAGRALKGA